MKIYGWKLTRIKRSTRGLGRFGGGWEWSLGITTNAKATIWIINLVIWQFRLTSKKALDTN
jgi:hypothetical protein